MSYLLSKTKAADSVGRIQNITPESANWDYVGFEVFELKDGQNLIQESKDLELCFVIVGGKANVKSGEYQWSNIGSRKGPFERTPPYAVFVGRNQAIELEAIGDVEIAVCKAPAKTERPARLITPEQLNYISRGHGTNERLVCNIVFGENDADSLLVVEVITPDGNWSSYPPHKHDTDNGERESQLEETYYHRINPSQGFAFQRVYTDDRSIDETMSVEDKDVVMVPKGYHPVGAPHGYELYYLNVMAGPDRRWVFNNDPDHDWIMDYKK
ncbi:5-deoxy-glucuronate isomerase [Shewanella sp. OPT22]|nr:5-deoxy-glucuronate isomerase [Shewanella sp. OPT22]